MDGRCRHSPFYLLSCCSLHLPLLHSFVIWWCWFWTLVFDLDTGNLLYSQYWHHGKFCEICWAVPAPGNISLHPAYSAERKAVATAGRYLLPTFLLWFVSTFICMLT